MKQNNENMTSYERKVLAKEAAEKQAKRKSFFNTIATIAIIAVLIALIALVPIRNRQRLYNPYFEINNKPVSEVEFNYHRTNLINSNAVILSYMGISSMEDLETVMYDESTGTTWSEFFTERAAQSIKENKALIADAKEKNVSLDVDAEYAAYMEQMKTEADAQGMNVDTYLTYMYGASEKVLKKIIMDNLTATLYSEHLSETMAASKEEAQAEYDANKDDYDSVDYRVLEFVADVAEATSEEEINTAMANAKAKAQEMLDKVKAGEDFETLCATYAPEEDRTDYADSETDHSLVTGATSYSSVPFTEWLFDGARTAGESTLYTDEEDFTHYVVLFEKRYMGENVLDTIQENLTYDAVSAYVSPLLENYTITDPDDNLPTL